MRKATSLHADNHINKSMATVGVDGLDSRLRMFHLSVCSNIVSTTYSILNLHAHVFVIEASVVLSSIPV